jgi:hypothetical protein
METQNVTLAIPKPILRKAKLLAVEQQTSLSGLMTQLLTDLVEQSDRYAEARARHLAWLRYGANLGTHGVISWTREDLHER